MDNKEKEAEVRLWIINRVAEVLTDLADDGDESVDMEEIFDRMRDVANLILEALDVEVVDSDGKRATITVGD